MLKSRQALSLAAACAALVALLAACNPPPTPTPVATLGIPGTPFTEMASGGVPNQISVDESAALGLGEVTYSGYACVTAQAGCACETPIVTKARFSLTADNHLSYQFSGLNGPASEWLFDHAGVNYWTYGTTSLDANGQPQALLLVSLSFTKDGYVLTQVANWVTGEVVQCPNVDFRRVNSSTPAP